MGKPDLLTFCFILRAQRAVFAIFFIMYIFSLKRRDFLKWTRIYQKLINILATLILLFSKYQKLYGRRFIPKERSQYTDYNIRDILTSCFIRFFLNYQEILFQLIF